MAWSLVLAGLALGVAATPHCAVMCGAPCAALTQGRAGATSGFHLGRLLGYMAAGALTASGVAALAAWTQAAPALRPFWTLLHLAFLGLGLWWMATGRQPAWMLRRAGTDALVHLHGRKRRAALAGLAWVAWPCAALQGALLLAALANSPQGGALVMAAFALASMPGLAVAPWAWARWRAWRGNVAIAPGQVALLGFRVAGAGLVLASGWTLTHGIWERFAAWCLA
ncbi:MAG: sulfite exporter TauE/SafE family protein [Burkholderiaceae bacterium]